MPGNYESYYPVADRLPNQYTSNGARTFIVDDYQDAVPKAADNVVANLTTSDVSAYSYVSAWRFGGSNPGTANLIPTPGREVGNHAVVEIGYSAGRGKITHYSDAGWSRRWVDVVGYFDG